MEELREEIIEKVDMTIWEKVMDDDFYKTKDKKVLVKIIFKMMDDVDTGYMATDVMVTQILMELVDLIMKGKYSLTFSQFNSFERIDFE